jgi:hypothetical protein
MAGTGDARAEEFRSSTNPTLFRALPNVSVR